MYAITGKLLITYISNEYLYQMAELMHNKIVVSDAINSRLKHQLADLERALSDFSHSFNRSKRNPYTSMIAHKHKQRIGLLAALRRHLNAARIFVFDPPKAEAATMLKEKLKRHHLWNYDNMSYGETTLLTRSLLHLMKTGPFPQLIQDTGVEKIIASLDKIEKEYEYLRIKRQGHHRENHPLPQKKARRKLIDAVMNIIALVDIYAQHEPDLFSDFARYLANFIKDANMQTRARQTRAKNRKIKQEQTNQVTEETSEEELPETAESGAVKQADKNDRPDNPNHKPDASENERGAP